MAEMSRSQDVSRLRVEIEQAAKGWEFSSLQTRLGLHENGIQNKINEAKKKLQKSKGQQGN